MTLYINCCVRGESRTDREDGNEVMRNLTQQMLTILSAFRFEFRAPLPGIAWRITGMSADPIIIITNFEKILPKVA